MAYAQMLGANQLDPHAKLAIWFIDIRNFRSINPKYGFAAGNQVLQAVARSIRACLCHDLPVARLGGDRFILLTQGLDFDQASEAFEAMAQRAAELTNALDIDYQLVFSAGIYYLRADDFDDPSFSRPLDYASIAHRKAHEEPRNSLLRFTDEDLERDNRRITIEQSVEQALATGEIQVWFQPQIDYTYGEVIGAEALARWHHHELGWIGPDEFIPVLEACGKVHDLDLYVWEEACRCAGRWRSVADGRPVPISVNVSRTEMFEPGLIEHFVALRDKYDLPKGSLHLEVTESAFVEEAARLYAVIEELRANSLMVEMDDFGSGLSSLTMLKDVPVDVVKLDMGFMRSTVSESRGGVVLGSVIRMLQGLDTPIIAEGVETLEQAELLKNMGCHLMQGYHFSRPMPRDDFEEYMATNSFVENTRRRERMNSHIDDLLSVDPASSYLFNHAIGGTCFFFAGEGTSESILANDQFYEECGLHRDDFGESKINPIEEVDPVFRPTMWRAAAEAHEHGSALCTARVTKTGRWLECVIRFLGESARGNVYSLNILRSGTEQPQYLAGAPEERDEAWNIDMLAHLVPHGFIKCDLSDGMLINYISPELLESSGLSQAEFLRIFHNSLSEAIVPADRTGFAEEVRGSKQTGRPFSAELRLRCGYNATRSVRLVAKVCSDEMGGKWLYVLILVLGDPSDAYEADDGRSETKAQSFDYDFQSDYLTIRLRNPDGSVEEHGCDHWMSKLDGDNDKIAPGSTARLSAMVRDLRSHPSTGFVDIKCVLRPELGMRWYHVNYKCEADENGRATVVHAYARDANDQMGSARWWRQQAETDQLTGLANRNTIEQEINFAVHTQGGGMMFMVDLDGFKRVNDELGHLAGDALLRDIAVALRDSLRDGDVLGRYGGDEFVAFVPHAGRPDLELVVRRAQQLIDAVAQVRAADGSEAACSVGVAVFASRDVTFYNLLEVADRALYQSKNRGKGIYTVLEV